MHQRKFLQLISESNRERIMGIKFVKVMLLFVFFSSAFGAPSKHSIWRNVKAFNELIKGLQKNSDVQKRVSILQHTLKDAATAGIMLGTINVEKQMEQNLLGLLKDFYKKVQSLNMKAASEKLKEIQKSIKRDNHAIEILKSCMDLALGTKNIREYRQALQKFVTDDCDKNQKKIALKTEKFNQEMIVKLQENVNNHLFHIRDEVNKTVQEAMKKMGSNKRPEKSSTSIAITPQGTYMNEIFHRDIIHLPHYSIEMPIWPLHKFELESFYRIRRQNEKESSENVENQEKSSKEEDFEDALESTSSNGGLAGLIASLSGGDGGSDVGALVGAISGVVTNLFGPGGLGKFLLIL